MWDIIKTKEGIFSCVLPCLSLTRDFRISSSKTDVDPHLVEDLHSPSRGLPELLILKPLSIQTDKTFLCCRKLSTKILAFNTKLSKPLKLEKAVHMYMRWKSSSQHFLQQLCSFQNLLSFLLLIFLHFYIFLTSFFPVSSLCCDFNASFPVFFLLFENASFPANDLPFQPNLFWEITTSVKWVLTLYISIIHVKAESFVSDSHNRLYESIYSSVNLQQQSLRSENLGLNQWPPIKNKSYKSLNWVKSRAMPVTNSLCCSSDWIQLGIWNTCHWHLEDIPIWYLLKHQVRCLPYSIRDNRNIYLLSSSVGWAWSRTVLADIQRICAKYSSWGKDNALKKKSIFLVGWTIQTYTAHQWVNSQLSLFLWPFHCANVIISIQIKGIFNAKTLFRAS